MNVLHQTICLQQLQLSALSRIHNGAVIARAHEDAAIARKFRQKLVEQPVFADVSQVHCC
jgi:hypothetical protein